MTETSRGKRYVSLAITIILGTLVALIALNAVLAFLHRDDADAAMREDCPGGTYHKVLDQYLGDEGHPMWWLAEFDMVVDACFGGKGHFNSASGKAFLNRNATAESLGYRYELKPAYTEHEALRLYGPLPPTTQVVGHTWKFYGTYKQCLPVPKIGNIVCDGTGEFMFKVTLWSKWMVNHDPYNAVDGYTDWSWKPLNGYAERMMIVWANKP